MNANKYDRRSLELSQNVHREEDKAKNGIQQCLTPNAIPFLTARGRRLNGVEALELQVVDTTGLYMANLTQANLQDLAGNAMTSSVVAAAMFAGLIVFREIFERGTGTMPRKLPAEPVFEAEDRLTHVTAHPFQYDPMPVGEARLLAAMSIVLCDCEYTSSSPNKNFQQCSTCKHTTCTSCGGNPEHRYVRVPQSIVSNRRQPAECRNLIAKALPRCIKLVDNEALGIQFLEQLFEEYKTQIDAGTWSENLSKILAALCSEVCLRKIKRKRSWEIIYDSPEAIIVLRISRENVEWQFSVNASKLPITSSLGKYFRKFPILRMKPERDGLDITKGQWQCWLPKESDAEVTITMRGPRVPSYFNEIGLTAHTDDYVATLVEVVLKNTSSLPFDPSGTYRLVPHCGQAFHSLHIKVETEGFETPDYFFFQHEGATGNPDNHTYIFTHDCSRIAVVGQYREYRARVIKQWRKHVFHSAIENDQKVDVTKIQTHGSWKDVEEISLLEDNSKTVVYHQLHGQIANLSDSCTHQHAVFMIEHDFGDALSHRWLRNEWTTIDKAKEALFDRDFTWAIGRGTVMSEYTHEADNWQNIDHNLLKNCSTCVPVPPNRFWALNGKDKMVPCERPDEATEYEHQLRGLPPALVTSLFISSKAKTKLKISMNPMTLVHRSASRLKGPEAIKASWLLVTDDDSTRMPYLPPLKIRSNHDAEEALHPADFRHTLRPEQLRALGWMLRQENDVKGFWIEEITEHRITSPFMRLWGMAQQEKCVKGGLLAFEVGFGKTAVTLGLIASQEEKDQEWAKCDIPGRIPLKATLIIVPDQLPEQWASEVKKFFVAEKEVITVRYLTDLNKCSLQKFVEAEIILVGSNVLESQSYRQRVAKFSATVEHDDNATKRAKREWYEAAQPHIINAANELRNNPEGFGEYLKKTYCQNLELADQGKVPSQSKRFRGQAYQKFKTTGSKRKHEETSTNDCGMLEKAFDDHLSATKDLLKFLIFEAFAYARVVVDEYTYITPYSSVYGFLRNVVAGAFWILSGTPGKSGHGEVRIAAKLLRIDLGEDELAKKGKEMEMTCERLSLLPK